MLGGALFVIMGVVGTTGAGDGSSTSTSTSTSTFTSGSADDTSGGGECGQCGPNSGDGGIVFGNLGDGTPPAGETVIDVWAQPKYTCDDCGCYDDAASKLRLELDGVPVGEPCDSDQCEFTVVLTGGTHAITAIATYDSGETSSSVQIEVPSEGGTTETGIAPADDAKSGGCGCTSARGEPTFAALLLAGAIARRRRRCARMLAPVRRAP
jgi:MYXO-CTERM domain-containing protein